MLCGAGILRYLTHRNVSKINDLELTKILRIFKVFLKKKDTLSSEMFMKLNCRASSRVSLIKNLCNS